MDPITEIVLESGFWMIWGVIFLTFVARYFLIAGGAYVTFWLLFRKKSERVIVQKPLPKRKHLIRDFSYSMSTFAVFGLIGYATTKAYLAGYTFLYFDINKYGWPYFFASILGILVLHDAYFYWAHRFMHIPGVYNRVHRVHHLSKNPSPWTSFAFSPIEAVLEGLIMPIALFVMPLHLYALVAFLFAMTTMNVIGHLGYELFWRGFTTHFIGKHCNTATHHNMHHLYVNCNYGLYYNWWDRWMKTNHPNYTNTFNNIKNGKPQKTR